MMPDVDHLAIDDSAAEITAMSYARIRQLSAHEVGHTIGFAHNFAASTYGRGSVMDYPAPLVEIRNGRLDFSNAYATGIGEFDKFSTVYSYAQFPAGTDETAELRRIVNEAVRNGMLYISDADARPAGAAHPLANLWDNGPDPTAMLRHEMQVRRIGLDRFGLRNIPQGAPLSDLELKFLPLYLHHRYQLTAAIKNIGGVYYSYAVRDGNAPNPTRVAEPVPAAKQREALDAVLATLSPRELAIPDNLLRLMPPTAYGHWSGRSEPFAKRTSPMFDAVGASEIAADMAISGLLESNRAARAIDQNSRDRNSPHFREVVDAVIKAAWHAPVPANANEAVVQRAVQTLTVTRLMDLAANTNANSQVRAVATEALRTLAGSLKRTPSTGDRGAHNRYVADEIDRFLARPAEPRKQTAPLPVPPGDPIGN